jgi:ABC-2 type transport system permease protein
LEALRIYFKMISISFQGRMHFRLDFFSGVLGVMVMNILNLALIGVILSRFDHLNGWLLWEIVFLYSLWILGHSVYSLLFWHIRDLEDYIIDGTFDQFMVRPVSVFLQFIAREVNYVGVADMVIGIAGISLALTNLSLIWVPWQWMLFAVAVLAGMVIEFGINLALASVAFWTGRSSGLWFTVFQFSFLIQQYPVDMFGRWFRLLVTAIIPVAFINYYPSLLLVGKIRPGEPWAWLGFASPLVALLLLAFGGFMWRLGIRAYSSAGN